MKISQLHQFLEEIDHQPRKKFSQNFLIDQNLIQKIVKQADIKPNDNVLEIGPGLGALTQEILKNEVTLHCIEKDLNLCAALNRLFTDKPQLSIHPADFLKFDLNQLPTPLKVIANLPYNITSPILEKLLTHAHQFLSLTIMVQKEVGQRLIAKAKTKQFGALTLFFQFFTEFKSSFIIPSQCFYPSPSVDSMVLSVQMKKELPFSDPNGLFALVRKAFQQRRKMLSRSLRSSYDPLLLKQTLKSLNLNEQSRPEDLQLSEWIAFYSELNKS